MRTTIGIVLAGLVLATANPVERLGRLDAPALREASGIVRSRRHADTFWVHNDSGNLPTLFAVQRDGHLIQSFRVAAPALDWEDVATDDAGHLYVGEIGNNDLRLRVRAIYRFDEPDPRRPATGPLRLTASTYYRFADHDRFDAESLFVIQSRAYLIAKWSNGKDAALYSVPLDPPASLQQPAIPRLCGVLPGCDEPATGADLTPDGLLLAVMTTKAARVYRSSGPESWELVATVRVEARDVEGICWDGLDLILAAEDRSLYRIAEKVWRADPGKRKR